MSSYHMADPTDGDGSSIDTLWQYARRRRCRALGYLQQLESSRSATRRSILEVGRALRAVDSRLKREWVDWAENGLYCKGIKHEQHRQKYDMLPAGEMTDSALVGLARTTNREQERGADSIRRPSAEAQGLLRRRRRRLRAWCSNAWETFRPRTNADLPSSPPEGPPAHELVFLRTSPTSFAERRSWPTVANDGHDEKPWCQAASVGMEPMEPDAQHDYPRTRGSVSGDMPATLAQEKGQAGARKAIKSDLCAAVERPLLVPCLRSGATCSAPAAAERASTTSTEIATNQPQEEQQKDRFHVERGDPPTAVNVEGSITAHNSGAERQEGRVSSVVEASVRAGDWVLPNRGGVSHALGGRRERGWLRVEAVSVGEECIILATRGTGGTSAPELRSSLKLLEISPALLTGALVVRQTTSDGNGGGHMEERASTEGRVGGQTEAFRLPVLSARWGLGLLRQWAADDIVFKALESPTPSEPGARKRHGCLDRVNVTDARKLSRQLRSRKIREGRSNQAPTRMKPGRDGEEGVATTAASTKCLRNEGCLRLSAPAGEGGLALAWTNSRNDQISIHLFTPGGNGFNDQDGTGSSQWTELYRGRGERFDVEGLGPCRRYFFRSRLSASSVATTRRVFWRHASFCTLPIRPPPPIAMRWTPGVPVADVCCNKAKSAEKLRRSSSTRDAGLDRPAVLNGGTGRSRWKNLGLKMTRGRMRSAPDIAIQKQHLLGEDCGTWIVEYRTQLRPRGAQLWSTGTRTALEWAGEPQATTRSPVGNGSSRSTHNGNKSDGDDGQERRDRRDGEKDWERAYRGKLSECVVGSLAEGVPYAFRCARENADGQVSPWSADLRCVVPRCPGKCGDISGDGDGNNGIDGRGHGDAAPPHRLPPPPETRTHASSPRRQQHQHRFDLLVPALVEAFAELVDAGDSRVARATPVNTRLGQPPPSWPPPAPHPAAKANRASADEALAAKNAEAEGRAHQYPKVLSRGGNAETSKMVWEEHWDTERRAPFFRLRGQSLSVWQIPAL